MVISTSIIVIIMLQFHIGERGAFVSFFFFSPMRKAS